jgi:hypothetical protein
MAQTEETMDLKKTVGLAVVALSIGVTAIAGDTLKGIAELQLMYPQELAQEAADACIRAQAQYLIAELYRSGPYRDGRQSVAGLEQRARELEYLARVGLVARAKLNREPPWVASLNTEAVRKFPNLPSLRQETRCYDFAEGLRPRLGN